MSGFIDAHAVSVGGKLFFLPFCLPLFFSNPPLLQPVDDETTPLSSNSQDCLFRLRYLVLPTSNRLFRHKRPPTSLPSLPTLIGRKNEYIFETSSSSSRFGCRIFIPIAATATLCGRGPDVGIFLRCFDTHKGS